MNRFIKFFIISLCSVTNFLHAQDTIVEGEVLPDEKIQKIRFIEDDAQNYMVSKLFELKHQKANDLVPFITGAIKRYAKNGSAERINYSAHNRQLIAVSCPIPLMPYIDDMIAKLDRPSTKDQHGSGIAGTGIIRNVYSPVWRSPETMVDIMVKSGISATATEGAKQDAVVTFDPLTNMIYWKDSTSKDKDLTKYLSWLDRPIPQCQISLNIYEVRESDLTDVGLDYLAWKNGPGLNLFEGGAVFLDGSALSSTFGPYGFFMFAPSFDLSFVRILQQNGKARIATSASLSIINGKEANLKFTPVYQNLTKNDSFASAVDSSNNDKLDFSIISPTIAISGQKDKKTGLFSADFKNYPDLSAILNFGYDLSLKHVVERDNHGNELYESFSNSGSVSVKTGTERLIARFVQETETEQTIGIPLLCELPILKYIFGTTTKNKEKVFHFVTVKTELLHPDSDISSISGKLLSVSELVTETKKEEK